MKYKKSKHMNKKSYEELLSKRLFNLLSQISSKGIIIEDEPQYGDIITHLRRQIYNAISILRTLK